VATKVGVEPPKSSDGAPAPSEVSEVDMGESDVAGPKLKVAAAKMEKVALKLR
jgi:hypothetical protein